MSENMKPSTTIIEQARAYLEQTNPPTRGLVDVQLHETTAGLRFALEYLDAEAERRARFEAEVMGRLAKLETVAHAPYDFTDLVERLTKLERLVPTEGYVFQSGPPDLRGFASMKMVQFQDPGAAPLCLDGRPIHDLHGKPRCRCGYAPPLVRTEGNVEPDLNPPCVHCRGPVNPLTSWIWMGERVCSERCYHAIQKANP